MTRQKFSLTLNSKLQAKFKILLDFPNSPSSEISDVQQRFMSS
jgi:hypothetical protein